MVKKDCVCLEQFCQFSPVWGRSVLWIQPLFVLNGIEGWCVFKTVLTVEELKCF